jgi:hypothetical protein
MPVVSDLLPSQMMTLRTGNEIGRVSMDDDGVTTCSNVVEESEMLATKMVYWRRDGDLETEPQCVEE